MKQALHRSKFPEDGVAHLEPSSESSGGGNDGSGSDDQSNDPSASPPLDGTLP